MPPTLTSGPPNSTTPNYNPKLTPPDSTALRSVNPHHPPRIPRRPHPRCPLLYHSTHDIPSLLAFARCTILSVDDLQRHINSYFSLLVSNIIRNGGDILRFAGIRIHIQTYQIVVDPTPTVESTLRSPGKRQSKSWTHGVTDIGRLWSAIMLEVVPSGR